MFLLLTGVLPIGSTFDESSSVSRSVMSMRSRSFGRSYWLVELCENTVLLSFPSGVKIADSTSGPEDFKTISISRAMLQHRVRQLGSRRESMGRRLTVTQTEARAWNRPGRANGCADANRGCTTPSQTPAHAYSSCLSQGSGLAKPPYTQRQVKDGKREATYSGPSQADTEATPRSRTPAHPRCCLQQPRPTEAAPTRSPTTQ